MKSGNHINRDSPRAAATLESKARSAGKAGRSAAEHAERLEPAAEEVASPVTGHKTAPGADATAQRGDTSVGEQGPRFRIFVINTGWHSAASRVLNENIATLQELTREEPIYVLDQKTSLALLRRHTRLIGRDPIITVLDSTVLQTGDLKQPHGFRLHLGLLHREDQVLGALQQFARFINTQRGCKDIDDEVRRRFRREGMAGAFEIIMGGSADRMLTLL
jgi:hypothetical protein